MNDIYIFIDDKRLFLNKSAQIKILAEFCFTKLMCHYDQESLTPLSVVCIYNPTDLLVL